MKEQKRHFSKKQERNFIISCTIAFFGFLLYIIISPSPSEEYKKMQNDYFSKVDYEIQGKMTDYRLLGGSCYFLIEVKIDSIIFRKNELKYKDDFVGLYSNKNNQIYFFACICLQDDLLNNNNNNLPYVKINSAERKIVYKYKNTEIEDILSPADIYRDYLKDLETTETIHW